MNRKQKRIQPITTGLHVAGYSRTGTTLLKDCLQNHPAVLNVTGENNLLTYMPVVRRKFPLGGDAQDRRRYCKFIVDALRYGASRALGFLEDGKKPREFFWAFESESDLLEHVETGCACLTDHKEFLCTAIDIIARKAEKTAWAGKIQPRIIYETLSDCSNQFVIGMIRDPRSVMASRRLHARKVGDPWSLILMALRYRKCLRQIAEASRLHPKRVILLKYEDFVNSPEEALKGVFQFLPLRYHPALVGVSGSNSSYGVAAGGIVNTSVARWKQELQASEVYLLQMIFSREMKAWGYQCENVPFSFHCLGEVVSAIIHAVGAVLRLAVSSLLVKIGLPKWRSGGRFGRGRS